MSNKRRIEVLARGVFVKNGKVLLCHTKGADNTYLPGGHVDFGEGAETSLQREMAEELGVQAVPGRFLGVVEHTFIQRDRPHCEVNLVFAMDIEVLDTDCDPQAIENYIEFRWVDLSDIAGAHLEPASLVSLLPAWVDDAPGGPRWGSNL